MNHPRVLSSAAVAGCLALLAAGCGSRLSEHEILAQNTVGAGGSAASGSAATGDDGAAAGSTTATTGSGITESRGVTGAGAPAAAPGAASSPGTVSTRTDSGTASTAGSATAPATKAPIVIGFIGQISGIGGPTAIPDRDAWIAWQKTVNARGGINGHPVQLLVGDDGGNESQTVAIARDFVENKHAIALTVLSPAINSVADYAKRKSVPIVGNGVYDPIWNHNPMLFPTYPSFTGKFTAAAAVAQATGVTKVATVYCVESSVCKYGSDVFATSAAKRGLKVVYRAGISITEPDYTAECLQMQNQGAQLVLPFTENSSLVRFVQSCARQQYHPIWEPPDGNDDMAKIPQFSGSIAVLPTFPWFLRSGSPGVTEYVQAMQKYAPNDLAHGVDAATYGWVSAKVFERAAAHVSDHPTSADILAGLWAMRRDSLDGLAPGALARTFTRGQPTPDVACVFTAKIDNGHWTAPQGLTPVCV